MGEVGYGEGERMSANFRSHLPSALCPLQTQVAAFKWLYQDVLDPLAQREGAERAALLSTLAGRFAECAAANARLKDTDAALARAEDELLRGADSQTGINKEMVKSRVNQRRARVRGLGECCSEALSMAAALTEFEHSRGLAPPATRQMDDRHISCLTAMEEKWRAWMGGQRDSQMQGALQRELLQQMAVLGARLEHFRAAAEDQRALSANASAAARSILSRLPATFSRVNEVLRLEESLVRDTQQGLDAVVKITHGLDSLEEIQVQSRVKLSLKRVRMATDFPSTSPEHGCRTRV
jgi:hypothetical protein